MGFVEYVYAMHVVRYLDWHHIVKVTQELIEQQDKYERIINDILVSYQNRDTTRPEEAIVMKKV